MMRREEALKTKILLFGMPDAGEDLKYYGLFFASPPLSASTSTTILLIRLRRG